MANELADATVVPVPLRRNTSFRRLIAATVSNELSGAMAGVALPLFVLAITGSATLAGVAAFVSSAAMISTQVFAGAVADRFAPDRTLRFSSIIQASAWGLLGISAVVTTAPVWVVILVAGIAGAASSLDGPSEHALIKVFVPQAQLGHAAAVSQGRESAAGLLGGPIGGGLFSVIAAAPFILQAVLHTLAALFAPRAPKMESLAVHEQESFLKDVAEGFKNVLQHPGLRGTAIVAGIANFPIVALPLAMIAYYQDRGVPSLLIGVFASSFGVGILVGSFFAGRMTTKFRLGRLGIVAISAFALGQVAVVITHANFWATCAVLAISALPLPAFNAAIGSYTAAITPASMMGRVVAALGVPGMILMPLGLLFAGISYDHLGIAATLTISAITACLAAIAMAASSQLRNIPLLSELSEGD
ncbi:MFS transporter [Arthrobacter alpinus]|uniref:MFS transporter n=1 Tax=Arthrobacter alpinus TaxID=656366 RepID=UPI0009F88DA4|nr:MFS transporter [Arthrobacter alpinus]